MPLNPAFEQQSTRALPFCVGYVLVQGDEVNSIFGLTALSPAVAASAPSGGANQLPAQVEQFMLADGEWDGCVMFTTGAQTLLDTDTLAGGVPIYKANQFSSPLEFPSIANRPIYFHFHGGSYSTVGMPNNLIGSGPDQSTDNFLNYFPTVTPALSWSNRAYYFVRSPATTSGNAPNITPVGVYRTTRCRIFDNAGNVIGYGFTTNPTWQMIETLLRFQIKPQQPALAGLTNAERACFDWPAMVAHAARNAFILPNGSPRFSGHFAFASDATLGSMMESQLRNCASYRRVRGSQIAFCGEETRASVFTFSLNNMVPGSLKLPKKDLTNAPNVYIPQYRDLGIPAISQVASVTTNPPTSGEIYYSSTFTTVSPQPFGPGNYFVYGGGSDDADFAGTYLAGGATVTINEVIYQVVDPIPTQLPAAGGPQKAATATGGYLGTQQSRFAKRAPEVVQHRALQKYAGQIAPGIPPTSKQIKVFYDIGNNTFDQTNRVMQFLMTRDLGPDGPNWSAPLKGSIAGYLESVDVNGNALLEVEPGDIITLDSTAAPSFAGLYEVVDPVKTYAPLQSQKGEDVRRELAIQSYYPNALSDVSAAPGSSFITVPGTGLPMGDILPAQTPFWLLQATPEGSFDGSTCTITVPDITIQWMGQTTPTTYPAVSLSGIPVGSVLTLYLVITNQATTPTLLLDTTSPIPGFPAGSNLEGLPTPFPYGEILLFFGILSAANTFSESTVTGGQIQADSAQAIPLISGASTGLVFTPSPATFLSQPGA